LYACAKPGCPNNDRDRRLAAILAANVGVREHRDGTSENRANGSLPRE
jgi:hypothetical protein